MLLLGLVFPPRFLAFAWLEILIESHWWASNIGLMSFSFTRIFYTLTHLYWAFNTGDNVLNGGKMRWAKQMKSLHLFSVTSTPRSLLHPLFPALCLSLLLLIWEGKIENTCTTLLATFYLSLANERQYKRWRVGWWRSECDLWWLVGNEAKRLIMLLICSKCFRHSPVTPEREMQWDKKNMDFGICSVFESKLCHYWVALWWQTNYFKSPFLCLQNHNKNGYF